MCMVTHTSSLRLETLNTTRTEESCNAPNKDLIVPACGPAAWSDGTPGEISVSSTAVRKDVIIIPARGYVVFHFIADNTRYWFMCCHIKLVKTLSMRAPLLVLIHSSMKRMYWVLFNSVKTFNSNSLNWTHFFLSLRLNAWFKTARFTCKKTKKIVGRFLLRRFFESRCIV